MRFRLLIGPLSTSLYGRCWRVSNIVLSFPNFNFAPPSLCFFFHFYIYFYFFLSSLLFHRFRLWSVVFSSLLQKIIIIILKKKATVVRSLSLSLYLFFYFSISIKISFSGLFSGFYQNKQRMRFSVTKFIL